MIKKAFLIYASVFLCLLLASTALAEGYPQFNFEKKMVTLNSGYEMPILGLGMFSLSESQAENSTYWALKAGFRLIDTARIYGNEAAVGRGLQRAIDEGIVTREEVFITTKMWTSDFSNGDAAIDASLRRLGVDYIDLMILHHSQPRNDVDAYRAMERAVADGKLRQHRRHLLQGILGRGFRPRPQLAALRHGRRQKAQLRGRTTASSIRPCAPCAPRWAS